MRKVIKRDGSAVEFDQSKIVNAILKANGDVDTQYRIPETMQLRLQRKFL